MSYCANALLGVMSTDLTFFETSVPIVPNLYKVFVAIGWGLLIGNCAFQSMKAMFAGLGFETESPAILLVRTGLFGTLLVFSKDICDIGLSIGKNVIDLLGIPTTVTLTMPTDAMFSGVGAGWLLVIIIGFVLGFQLIKLFFEIAERYVVVAVLTLLCPVGLAMGGSKSTKDICVSFMRTYVSMIVMMVMNVLFLKLILSALATMPSGAMVLPWCLLVVGIAKTARKADQLISKIGLNPATTGDPLGAGRGLMVAMMAARTIMYSAGKVGGAKGGSGKTSGGSANNSSRNYGGNANSNVKNSTGGTNVGGNNVNSNNMAAGAAYGATTETNANTQRNSQSSNIGGAKTNANTQSASNLRFGASAYGGVNNVGSNSATHSQFSSSGNKSVNSNRFGNQQQASAQNGNNQGGTAKAGTISGGQGLAQGTGTTQKASTVKGSQNVSNAQNTAKNGVKPTHNNRSQKVQENAKKTRFGASNAGTVRHNQNPIGKPKTATPNVGPIKTTPISTKVSASPDNIDVKDKAKDFLQDVAENITPKDGDNDG